MSKIFASLAVTFALVSTALAAQAQAPTKSDPDEVICKREKKVNSRFTTRTCFTRAQWDEMAEQNKRDYAAGRDRPVIETRRD